MERPAYFRAKAIVQNIRNLGKNHENRTFNRNRLNLRGLR